MTKSNVTRVRVTRCDIDRYRDLRRLLWRAANDGLLRELHGLRERVLSEIALYMEGAIKKGRSRGLVKDYELLIFTNQVFCPRLVKAALWSVGELIGMANSLESLDDPRELHSREKKLVSKYGDAKDRKEWNRLRKILEIKTSELRRYPGIH